jgi:hypothetical protein
VLRLPQRDLDAIRGGHLHRAQLAPDDDGELRAGSLLARRSPA